MFFSLSSESCIIFQLKMFLNSYVETAIELLMVSERFRRGADLEDVVRERELIQHMASPGSDKERRQRW